MKIILQVQYSRIRINHKARNFLRYKNAKKYFKSCFYKFGKSWVYDLRQFLQFLNLPYNASEKTDRDILDAQDNFLKFLENLRKTSAGFRGFQELFNRLRGLTGLLMTGTLWLIRR